MAITPTSAAPAAKPFNKDMLAEALRRNLKGGFRHLMPGPSATTSSSSRSALKQRNLKQKFVALLKKFKINEVDALTAVNDATGTAQGSQATSRELQALFEELDNLSDSGGELDNMSQVSSKGLWTIARPRSAFIPFFNATPSCNNSLQSTIHSEPKPRLPTYFNSATNLHNNDGSLNGKMPLASFDDVSHMYTKQSNLKKIISPSIPLKHLAIPQLQNDQADSDASKESDEDDGDETATGTVVYSRSIGDLVEKTVSVDEKR